MSEEMNYVYIANTAANVTITCIFSPNSAVFIYGIAAAFLHTGAY
jgi:hypothetical protein